MKIEIIELGMLDTNCYILWDDKTGKGIVIDPGSYEEKLINKIEEYKLEITHILITHGHFDHIGGVKYLKEKLQGMDMNPIVIMSELEKKDIEKNAPTKYHKLFFQLDHDVIDGQELDLGFIRLKALLLPGHTNYSMCFYSAQEKCVFVGDTLFFHSIGTEYYYDGPDTDLADNIVKVLFALPKETIVFPGHKQSTTVGEEMERNPYLSDADTIDPWTL